MKEPRLSSSQFLRDEVLFSKRVADAQVFASASGAALSGGICCLAGRGRVSVRIRTTCPNLSDFNQFALTVRNVSSAAVLAGLKLFFAPTPDHGRDSIVSFTGGRELVPVEEWVDLRFPAESFGSYGGCQGWSDVQEIELTFGFDRNFMGPDHVEIHIVGLYAERRDVVFGPRLTEEGLREVLENDPDEVLGSFSRDHRGALHTTSLRKTALDRYTARNLEIHIPPPHPYPANSADQILNGRIMGHRIGHPIPWKADPIGAQEWTHFLNRHHFARELAKAYAATGAARYAGRLDTIVESWIRENPVPVRSNGGAGPSWETLTAGWRLREWLWIGGIAWSSPSFRRGTLNAMLRSVWEHAMSLMDHTGHPNNWIIVESAALALAGFCFPCFREAQLWTEVGIERLSKEFETQFFGDGAHFELSPLYHAICLHALVEVSFAAQAVQVRLPEELTSSLEQCAEYLAALCRPDFTWPSINDSGSSRGDYCALMVRMGEAFGRSDFAWVGSRGKSGDPTGARSRAFPEAGIAVMRSDRRSDANFLLFRAGPAGAAHVHDDVLSLDVTALGRPRLVDPGVTSYAPDSLTDFYRSALSHNTILINGKGAVRAKMSHHERIRPAGGRFSWLRREDLEVAQGVCKGPWEGTSEKCIVCRSVIFIRGEYWVVTDEVECPPGRRVTVCWQFSPGRVELDPATSTALFLDANGPGLKLVSLVGSDDLQIETATGLMAPPRGWVSMGGSDFPAPSLTFTCATKPKATLAWLLLPFSGPPGSKIGVLRVDRQDHSIQLEITFPAGYTDYLSIAPGRAGLTDADAKGFFERLTFQRAHRKAP
jgi:hypothetical protein